MLSRLIRKLLNLPFLPLKWIYGYYWWKKLPRKKQDNIWIGFILGLIVGLIFFQSGSIVSISSSIVNSPSESLSEIDLPDINTTIQEPSYNSSRVEHLTLKYVNDKRELRNMPSLRWNQRAHRMAKKHANDMARNNYFSHTSLSGVTQQERYSFCQGGENIAQTFFNERVRTESGNIEIYTSSHELAKGLVNQWMNSTPHRERGIYGSGWRSAGVGVSSKDDKIYAVMGFCQ